MARSLRAHVQVDRLPDVGDDTFVQIGIRVSAAIVEAAQDGDEKFILPWLWRKADGTPWDPHASASWKVYHLRAGDQTPLPIAADDLIFLTASEAGVPLFDPPDGTGVGIFRQRIDQEVADIVKTFGVRQAFEAPAQGVISGRTVYGLAESLTSLPNPVPAAMKVWTAARVEKAKLDHFDKEDQFLAVPVFAAAGAAYEPQDPVLVSDQWTAGMTRTGGDPVEATALIHPSLPASRLEIGDNPQRLIDLSHLTIRAQEGQEFESADWIASIGARVAEAIDPAARAMAVLDVTIAEAVRTEPKTREALRADMTGDTPKDLFRKALTELHRPIVTPRARRSEAAMAPAASFLEALALRTPQLWPTVVPLLFAQAGAENESSTPDASTPPFAATSCARLLGTAGIPPSPSLKTADAGDVTGQRIPTLDTELEFVDWLARHWTACPQLAESTGDRSFEGTSRVLTRKSASPVVVEESFERAGVVDFARVSQETVIPIQISALEPQELPCTVTVVFERPREKQPDSSLTIELTFAADKTTIQVDGQAPVEGPHPLTDAQLALKVTAATAGAPPQLSLSYTQGEASIPLTFDASKQVLRGRMGIRIKTTKKIKLGIDPAKATMSSVDRERLAPQAQALRAALSWGYAGPVVPGLLQGWVPIKDQLVAETGKDPLAVRLPAAMKKFIQTSFQKVFADLAQKISEDANDPLRKLFEALCDAAIGDAQRLADAIVPPALGDSDRVTQDALPLAFLVSQLQDFDEKDDLWGRLGGVGVLISRDDQLAANEWWSLNAASLHVAKLGANGREPLTKATAVLTAVPTGSEDTQPWKKASKVDPVPLSVGDVGGARSALVKYENHSIVGEVEGAPQVDPAGQQGAVRRRPEAFLFPPTHFTRMPALTFGRTYGILPYLIGHGGALPVPLRQDPFNPVKLKELDADDKLKITEDLPKRKTPYLRTVPVGAPRLAGAQWPGTFPGVDPLVDELPLRPAPLTLKEKAEARFFIDQKQLTGLLSSREDAIRIEIGEIAHAGASASLLLRADMRGSTGTVSNALTVEVEVAKLRAKAGGNDSFGLRIEAGQTEGPKLWVLRRREHEHADDAPDAILLDKNDFKASLTLLVEQWDSTYLVVAAQGGSFDCEPPTIRWASKSADGTTLVLAGDRPILPPELAHAARKVAVLDGIRVGGKTGPSSVTLSLRRPSTPVSTYERWINGPTGKYGAGNVDTIRKTINAARVRAADLGRGDRSFDDPAVEALFVEVIQLFPRRVARKITTAHTAAADGPVRIAKLTPESLDERLRFDNPQFATLNVKVVSDLQPTSEEDTRDAGNIDPGKNTLDLKLAPGCAYEIRLYGAVPEKQTDFAPAGTATADRFSPAVRASWRDVKDAAAATWHLGTPLTLTVEVATEIMPECWRHESSEIKFDHPAFAIDLARPPAVVEDRALVRLVPENLGPPILQGGSVAALRYPAFRYVNRAALINQRWSWRGRPHPRLVVGASPKFGTKGALISDELGEFVDAAFLGRADDDIGAVREVAFGRAHALGGQDTVTDSSTEGKRPVLLEHDLDRRAGTHLWRFALRLKSRYAAMRPSHPDLLRFSHLQKNSSLTQWWRVVVPDRTHPGRAPRGIDRPSLMLVLPLTEPLMTEGSVPPLLAVFNQEMFPQFNAADGIEAVIDVARHPFPGQERIKRDQPPKDDPTTTFGALFDARWKEVAQKRGELDQAEAEYAQSVALRSAATKAEQDNRQEKRKQAFADLQAKENAFKAIQEKGAAWGAVKQLDDVRKQVEEALAHATTDEERQRLQKRLDVDLPAEKAAAESFAKGLEDGSIQLPIVAGTPANPFTKYFQEFSPDTLREATPAADRPVAIRVDGPVGYTFDAGTEAGRFDHAAFLVSPVAEIVRPGSFMRLRFRRMETPGLLVAAAKPDPTWPDEPPAALAPPLTTLPVEGARFLIARSGLGAPPATDKDVHGFETAYEGLAFEIADLATASTDELRFKLVPPMGDEADHPQATTVSAKIDNSNKVVISAQTHLGKSAEWSLPLSEGAKARLQILVSLRPKPNTGPDANVQEYTPVGDVSVRLRIEPADGDPVQRPQEGAWLSVLCMPLTTDRKFTDLVAVQVCPKEKIQGGLEVKPLRLSDFAPAVWCQFAAVMSRFKVEAETSSRSIVDVLPVSALHVTLAQDAKTFNLGLNGLRSDETLTRLTLLTEGDPTAASDGQAQVEEPIYAVVTRFVYDAFDRLRERAIGIHPLNGSALTFGPRVWPPGKEEDREPYTNAMHGRVRFLRVLRGKLRENGKGGFETSLREFPLDFFGTEPDEALDAEPFDAAGMVMGISAPIEWGSD